LKTIVQYIGKNKIFALLNKSILTFNGLLTVFVIIRTIPKFEFGLLTLINTFDLFIFAISGGLVLQALQKYAAEVDGNDLDDLITNSVFLYGVMSLVPALILALLSTHIANFLHAERLSSLLKFLPLLVISYWGRKIAYFVLLAKEKLKEVFAIDFVPFTIKAVLILALYFSNHLNKALTIVIVNIISNFGAAVVSLSYLKKSVQFNWKLNTYWVNKVLNFGKYSFGTTIGNIIHTRTDTLMIAYFYDPITLAMYNSARRIADFFRNFIQAANMIVLPRVSNLFSRNELEGVKAVYYKGIIFSLILVSPIALTMVLIPNFVLYLAYSGKYQSSTNILRMFAICSFISPFGTIGSSVTAGIGKPNFTFIAMWSSVIVNVCLNLILVHKYGAIGAAYATLAAMILGGTIITIFIHHKINLSITSEDTSFVKAVVLLLRNK